MLYLQNNSWARLAFQLIGTVLILLYVPADVPKLIAFIFFWFLSFYPIRPKEFFAFLILSMAMTVVDISTIAQGVFFFTVTSFFGIPYFQTILWGFYFLHWTRVYEKAKLSVWHSRLIPATTLVVVVLIILYTVETHNMRLLLLGIFFSFLIAFFHTKTDWVMYLYGAFTGLAIELIGVLSGQWYYTGDFISLLGVPIWQFIIWGITAWFVGQILFPFLHPHRKC